jgi:hypothetical protein
VVPWITSSCDSDLGSGAIDPETQFEIPCVEGNGDMTHYDSGENVPEEPAPPVEEN